MVDSSKNSQWAKGAAVLGIAAVISKLLGTLQKIPLQNVAGDRAYGIYTAVYPFYILILFLATAGFPVAVSAFVASRLAKGDRDGAERALRVAIVLLTISGIAGFVLLYFGADTIAGWIGSMETAPAIRSVSFALLFVPLMSALRGYFQGGGDMLPTAVSQVSEQFVRVGTMIAVLIIMTMSQMEDRFVAAGATFGAVTGACAGMAVMLHYWQRYNRGKNVIEAMRMDHRSKRMDGPAPLREPYLRLAAQMLRYAIPICLGAIAVPVLNIVDTFTLPRLFREPGMDDGQVMKLFGVYARGLPLVQMTAMLVSSIAIALVPAIATAKAQKNEAAVRGRTELSLRITWMIGAAASVGLALTASPVNRMLFENGQGTTTMSILAFTAMFSMLNITAASVLQGAGSPLLPAIHLLLAAAIKIGLNFALTPIMGMNGAALAAVIAFGAAAVLNIAAVVRTTRIRVSVPVYLLKTGFALGTMAVVVFGWRAGLESVLASYILNDRLSSVIVAITSIALGSFTYAAALLRLRAVSAAELQSLPGLERKLFPLLKKLRLIPA